MRILIGYDGSPCADAALDDLARAGLPASAEALVLSVADLLPLPEGRSDAANVPRVVRAWRTERGARIAEAAMWSEEGRRRLARAFPGWVIDVEARGDSPHWALIDRAKSWNADLLAVGSHGRSAIGRAWFGSVAQSVVHHATCAVRVCRGHPDALRARGVRLVVGVDGSTGSDAAVAAVAGRSWPAGSAARVVTAINAEVLDAFRRLEERDESPESRAYECNEAVARRLSAAGHDAATIVVHGDS
jgi:nucleotide-binding universal stress UspA family protein